MYRAVRFDENPLIHPGLSDEIGTNINGPSLIRVPDWAPNPLGRYYLYFAHHQGKFIRMAFADSIRGPWTVHPAGVLRLEQTCCRGHIASPDVHVLSEQRELVMYFHGCTDQGQRSFRAVSRDGLRFEASNTVLGPFYFRVFRHQGAWFAIAKVTGAPGGGALLRSEDGIEAFEQGPNFIENQRHVAVLKRDDEVRILFSRGQDCPERILAAAMPLAGDWRGWQPLPPHEILKPETEYEGGSLPLRPSRFGAIHEPARELRDPAVFEEDGKLYLLYTGAGEACICGAELLIAEPE